jgi:hypothetical protein
MNTRRLPALLALTGLALALAGCSGRSNTSDKPGGQSSTTDGATTATTSASGSTTSTVGIAGYVIINGKKVAIPDERGDRPVQAGSDVGEEMLITPDAIKPKQLFCQVHERLTVTNLTDQPQRLHFVNDGGWYSPVIAPGEAWHYTPKYGLEYDVVTGGGLQADFQASAPLPGNP